MPYPHPRYSQITVPDFIFGGMENTSATTLTDLALLDERAALDHDVDGAGLARAGAPVVRRSRHLPRLVRGLAQRGLRDLLRVRVARARQGARRGRLRAARRRRGLPGRGGPLPAARRVPPVRRADRHLRRHLYEKGGRVLHMLRHELGDDAVLARARATTRASTRAARSRRATWRAPSRRSRGAASTSSSTAGSRAPGHPELEARWEWDDERKVGTLRVAQKQTVSAEAPLFRVSTRSCASRSTGRSATSASASTRGDPRVRVPAAGAPDAGDLRSRRRHPEDGEDGEAAPAVAAAAGGGAPGHRSRRSRRRRSAELVEPASVRRARRARCAAIASGPCASRRRARSGACGATTRATLLAGRHRRRAPARAARGGGRRSASAAGTSARRARWRRCCSGAIAALRRGRGGAGAGPHALAAAR